ncbi:MAG: hypothetical protein ACRBF0_14960 [Calditrichia bacterium]
MAKEDLGPIYSELLGYMSQSPEPQSMTDFLADKAGESVWKQLNKVIEMLETELEIDLSRFKIVSYHGTGSTTYVYLYSYRQKLGGLIAFLHRKYFKSEPPPFSDMPPTTIINQTQSQHVDIQLMLDLRGAIEKALPQTKKGSPEYGFLTKIKETMSTADTGISVMSKVLRAANGSGLSLEKVKDLLGL